MKLYPQITFTRPDGSVGNLFAGATDSIRESEGAIRTALAEVRLASGTNPRIAFIEPGSERCRYRYRVKPP